MTLLERLRTFGAYVMDDDGNMTDFQPNQLTTDAADEIERLRAELDAERNEANLLMLEIQRLRAEVDLKGYRLDDALDEIERLRATGDHLVRLIFSSTIPSIDSLMEYLRSGIDAWEEARRG